MSSFSYMKDPGDDPDDRAGHGTPDVAVSSGVRGILTMATVAFTVMFGRVASSRGRRAADPWTDSRNSPHSACAPDECRTPLNPCESTNVQRCRGACHVS